MEQVWHQYPTGRVPDPTIGRTISQYKILEKLGEGGMGVVYKAHDTRLDRVVALKFLPPADSGSAEDHTQLLREARSAAAINHPNICSVFDVHEAQGEEFLVMEYVEGRSLRSWIDAGPIPLPKAIKIALQIAAGLQAAHKKSVVHADMKPENILLTADEVPKITDFGLARSADRAAGSLDGVFAGTIAYMSPEQVQGGEIGRESDLWSFGVILSEMVAGARPFAGEYPQALMYAITHDKHRSAAELGIEIPDVLQKIIDRCLEKIPAVRFPDAGALIDDLKRLESGLKNPAAAAVRSIAVLPFADISPEKDNKYFSDGLTEEITANLSKLGTLRVLSRTSVVQYDRSEKTSKEIAADLGVQYLLEGSIRKAGKNLRITTQLVDASKDSYQWSETFRGTMDDIFDIQETVAAKIVKALKLRLTPGEKKKLKRRSTKNTEAYQLYLKGRFFWNKRNKKGILAAIRFFTEAIDADPLYPQAWAGLADAYNILVEHPGVSRQDTYPKAKAAVTRALELDDQLGEARASLASLIMLYDWDWAKAEKEFRLSIYLNPNYATAHHWYAEWFLAMDRVDEAIAEMTIAAKLDPLSPAILKDLGMMYYYAGRYDEAIEYGKKTLEIDPNFVVAYRLFAVAYQGKGMIREAIAENERWAKLTGNAQEGHVWNAYVHAAAGNRAEAEALLAKAFAEGEIAGPLYRAAAIIYAEFGEMDRAFEWLDKAYAIRSETLVNLKVDRKMRRFHGDPRYHELLRKVGLEKP